MHSVVLFSDVRGAGGETDIGFVPLSLITIASHLRRAGISASIVDAQIDADWQRSLIEASQNALYLGVSALTGPSLVRAIEAVGIVRRERPELPVVWGGYHATQAYEGLLRECLADVVVLGPGEHAGLALAQGLLGRPSRVGASWLEAIQNVAYLSGSRLVAQRSPVAVDPAQLDPVDYDCVDLEPYFELNGRALPYISSYGCPHACSFCAEPTQSQRKWRGRTAPQVVADLARLVERYAPRQINICDPNFSSSPSRVSAIVDNIQACGLEANLLCDMRATDVLLLAKRLDLARLSAAGFKTIYLGAESGSDAVLSTLAKGLRAHELFEACRLLDDSGISTIVSFMHDLPGETEVENGLSLSLAERLLQLSGNLQRHHFFTPYPATAIYESSLVRRQLPEHPIAQSAWAKSSTYGAGTLWPGRGEFRSRCYHRLLDIRGQLATPDRLTLPTLQHDPCWPV